MGEDKYFLSRIRYWMQHYDVTEWRNTIHGLRLKNGKKIDEKIFDMLYIHIDAAAMEAKKLAEERLPPEMKAGLNTRIYQAGRDKDNQKMGQAPEFDVNNMYK